MIIYKLKQENFNHLKTVYKIIPITIDNYIMFYQYIVSSILYFNDEVVWNDMFTLNDAYKRLKDGMTMYIGLRDSDVFGYTWCKDIAEDRLIFNVFIRNKINNKDFTGKEFISDIIYRYEYTKTIWAEVDDWNEKSIKLFERLGFCIV